MKTLQRPTQLPRNVFRVCIDNIQDSLRNNNLRTRLDELIQDVVDAATEFEERVNNVSIHQFPSVLNPRGVSNAELINIYTYRMVGTQPARAIYDALISAPDNEMCPFCKTRIISQLDHYLPKSLFPILSVVPINLVPICKDCNDIKKAKQPMSQTDQTFHPYFDDFESERWLYGIVSHTTPPAIRFEPRKPNAWDDVKFARLSNQFGDLELAKLYSSYAAGEFRNIELSLRNLHRKGGLESVRIRLNDDFASRINVDLNSWQTATYDAIANDDWYCDGGFKLS